MKFKAFTLAELLIALAILGVIATFTIPKVLTAQAEQQKKAVLQETLAALSQAHYQWYLEGGRYIDHPTYWTYIIEHLNAIKVCPNNSVTQGCNVVSGNGNPGVLLASGATIILGGFGAFDYEVDWNGEKLPNVDGNDIVYVFASADTMPYCGIKPGAVGFPESSCSGFWSSYAVWKLLYEDTFK